MIKYTDLLFKKVYANVLIDTRNPESSDIYDVGDVWVNKTLKKAWICTSINNNVAIWTNWQS